MTPNIDKWPMVVQGAGYKTYMIIDETASWSDNSQVLCEVLKNSSNKESVTQYKKDLTQILI